MGEPVFPIACGQEAIMKWLFVYLVGEDWKAPRPEKLDRINADGSYIGGTIISLIRVMKYLQAQGYEVDLDEPRDVEYDVLTICREPGFIVDFEHVRARRRVLWLHDIDQRENLARFARHYNGVITVSPFLSRRYADLGLPMLASTNPMEPVSVQRTGSDHLSMCFAGMFIEGRGVDFALEVLARLQQEYPDCRLHIYGSHSLWESPRGIVRHYCGADYLPLVERALANVDPRGVVFHGNVANTELIRRFASHDFLLVPADVDESCSMVSIEAQAVGTVVIASQRGALPDTVRPGGLCLPLEPETWASRIAKVYRNDWDEYSRRGKKHFRERFCIDRVLGEWLQWLKKLPI
jgi:glycosyltransferase involved in cell wall biosynthesis